MNWDALIKLCVVLGIAAVLVGGLLILSASMSSSQLSKSIGDDEELSTNS